MAHTGREPATLGISSGRMIDIDERRVETPVGPARVWQKGEGDALGFFAGLGGLPAWMDVLDALAADRQVVAPSLPGYPGGAQHEGLDDPFDWALAASDAYEAAGLWGADLLGASVGGALAAEVAALHPQHVRRLVLAAPLGLFDESDPVADVFAQRADELPAIMSTRPDDYARYRSPPDGFAEEDWLIVELHAAAAAAQMLWPVSDTGLAKRLPRITAPTLILWGEQDRVISPNYAERFAEAISGPTEIVLIPSAGHNVLFDAPDATSEAITRFLIN